MATTTAARRSWLGSRDVHIARDLSTVTDIAIEQPASAGGLSEADVRAIWQSVEKLYRTGAYPGVSFCLRRRGAVLLDRALGHASGNGPDDGAGAPKRLLTTDTPVCLFSASKAVTAILIHKLAEDRGVALDQRVSHYLPKFAAAGKRDITLAEVLAHRGGFPTLNLPSDQVEPELLTRWDELIDLICSAPVKHTRRMAYHAITGGFIAAEVLQKVTGQSIQSYLDQHFRKPLKLKHFTYGLSKRHRKDVALNYMAGQPVRFPIAQLLQRALMAPTERVVEISNSELFMDAVIPAGNLYATAEELSRFYQMLLNGGSYGGRQLLKSETVQRAVRARGAMSFDSTLMIPMRYSEGMMLGASPVGLYGPMSAQAYGHLGFMNILGWADPQRDIACGLLVTGKAVLGGHLLALAQLMNTIVQRCR